MQNIVNNGAFIDGANLHKAIEKDGWVLDYARFRIWLKEKHKVKHAYLFMGYIPKYADLYKNTEEKQEESRGWSWKRTLIHFL